MVPLYSLLRSKIILKPFTNLESLNLSHIIYRKMSTPTLLPPVAEKHSHTNNYHGQKYSDEYHWFRNKKDPKVVEYLTKENEYTKENHVIPNEKLTDTIYNEFISHLNETDTSISVRKSDYLYFSQTEKGLNYPIYKRKHISNLDNVETILDQNLLKDFDYQDLGFFTISPNHSILAYSLDISGDEIYTAYFKDLKTGEIIHSFEGAYTDAYWSNDGKIMYYTVLDSILRPYKVMKFDIENKEHELVFEEKDEKFTVGLERTDSNDYILINTSSSLTVEIYIIDANSSTSKPKLFQKRELGYKYDIAHQNDKWFILSNHNKEFINFKLFETSLNKTERENWKPVFDYDPKTHLTGIETLKDYFIIYQRSNAIKTIRIYDKNYKEIKIDFNDKYYSIFGTSSSKYYYDKNIFRYSYVTRLTPRQYHEFEIETGKKTILKETLVPNYNKDLYVEERIHVPIPQETIVTLKNVEVPKTIPVTILYRKDKFKKDSKNPCMLYGYGSYGISLDSEMNPRVISYLDRGIVYAVAHIRGGGDCGKGWYESGKFLYKKNTFTDFIAVSDELIKLEYTNRNQLAIEGRSAGGLLIGATINLRPDISKCAIAGVPFVDVINTMMDPTIPLTVNEYEEWGNPNEKEYFDYMLSYSPYDQIKTNTKLPNLLVKAGLNDPRVQYWEPTKWVSKLREYKLCDYLIYDCKMGSGHFGTSGRYGYLKELALDYSFVISQIKTRE